MGWPLNTVESLGSFSVGRYGAPLWLEGRLRLTAGQSGEAPDEVPGSCRSRGPAVGQLQSSSFGHCNVSMRVRSGRGRFRSTAWHRLL